MKHTEQRIWLIKYLLNEDERYKDYDIPKDEKGQKDLLRALMNVRMPNPISEEFLKIQDEYLREENESQGLVDGNALASSRLDERLILWQGDMSKLIVDAVVNPANTELTY